MPGLFTVCFSDPENTVICSGNFVLTFTKNAAILITYIFTSTETPLNNSNNGRL